MEVDAPRVGIVMGSKSDMPAMEKAGEELERARHPPRDPRDVGAPRSRTSSPTTRATRSMRGLRVIIAGAGLSAALPGVVAAHTDLPVIGVPLTSRDLGRGRARRAAVDRADAAGRAGGLRGRGQRAQRRRAGGAHPRTRDRALHPARDRAPSGPTRPASTTWRERRGRRRRGARTGRPPSRPGGDPRARRSRSRRSTSARRSPTTTWRRSSTCWRASAGDGRALDPLRADVLGRARHRARRCSCSAPAR